MAAAAEEKGAEEQVFSKGDLRRQLYASLRSTGVLDSMKGQLRARLLEHLRRHKEGLLLEEKKQQQRKPSVTERLLNSLFLEYLNCNGFAFTVSVFVPESQMSSWPPLSHQEMLALLHLDSPSSDLGDDSGACLAYKLVQQMAHRCNNKEVSTQTTPCNRGGTRTSCTSPRQLERSLKEVEDAYIRKKDAQRSLQDRSLEDNLSVLHQEFDTRVNTEVALQVCRIRDYEINAARMDEAARYRRQLARDREELEEIHKSRMDRIKAREESLLERIMSKEKAVEASAYEQRQRILREITSLRERESNLRQWKEAQERREEKLDEREMALRAMKEEVELERKALHAQADEIAASRRKELEVQYRELCDRLHQDQTLLAAEWEQLREERVAVSIEQASSRSDKELIQALHRRLSVAEDERVKLEMCIRELEEKLKQQTSSAAHIPDQRLEERLRESHAELEKERIQRQASEKEKKTFERKLQQKKVELAAARSPKGEWITEHKSLMTTIYKQEAELQQKETQLQLMETEKEKLTDRHMKLLLKIDHLDTLVKKAQEEKDHLVRNVEILQFQQTTNERELLETTTLLRKAQQALEAERLEHCALRSHLNAATPSTRNDLTTGFQDKLERKGGSVEYESSVAVSTVKDSFQENSKPEEAHELWTRLLSNNAAKRASLDLERNHFVTSKLLPSGKGAENIFNSNDGFATKVQRNRSEVCISGNDPILSWNRSEVTRGGNITEECDKELLLVPSSSLTKDFSPSAHLPNPGAPNDLIVLSHENEDDAITQDVETQEEVETRDVETQRGEGTWNSNEGEQEKRHSEAEEEYPFSRKYHDLESLQSRDETHMGSQTDSHSQSDHIPPVMAEVLQHPQIHEEINKNEAECQSLDQSQAEEINKNEAECQTLDQSQAEEINKNEAECQTLDQSQAEEINKNEVECQTLDQSQAEEINKNEAECQTLDQSQAEEINKNEAECQTLDQSQAEEINKNEAECQTLDQSQAEEINKNDEAEYQTSPAEIAGNELEGELRVCTHKLTNLTEEEVGMTADGNSDPLMCKLGLITTKEEKQEDESRESERGAGGRMSGLPELMIEMRDQNTPPDEASYGAHALEALTSSSIVIRKQDESSPRTLALAIRNNQLVEVGKGAEEEERGNPEAISAGTKASVDAHSSGEDSAYNSDSFEEDEEEEDQAQSEESCTNPGVRMTPRMMTGSSDLEGGSEQGSHSPQGDEHK